MRSPRPALGFTGMALSGDALDENATDTQPNEVSFKRSRIGAPNDRRGNHARGRFGVIVICTLTSEYLPLLIPPVIAN